MGVRRRLRIAILLFLPCAAILGGFLAYRAAAPGPGTGGATVKAVAELAAELAVEPTGTVQQGADLLRSAFAGVRRAVQGAVPCARTASRWVVSGLRSLFAEGVVFRPAPPGPREESRPAGALSQPNAVAPPSAPPVAADPAEAAGTRLTDRHAALKAVAATALKARHRVKTAEEQRVEALIHAAFQEYFRDYTVAGRTISVRMPFGVNGEREGGAGFEQKFLLAGKGTPEELWKHIDTVLASEDLAAYLDALSLPGEKVMILDLERRSYQLSRDPELAASLRAGLYPGTPTRVFVHRFGGPLPEVDLYNYLYAVASVGVDCSGMVQHVHQRVARACGADLEQELAKAWRIRPRQVRYRVGLWFYDPASGYTVPVEDRIEDLRPADILLFEGSDGSFKHSAVIQSIDFDDGLIRYVQSTDWAAQSERGVHESLIRFDPAHPEVDLRHYSVRWLQQVRPPFEGELEPRDWLDDGDRYLWYLDAGGSRVVRLRALADQLLEREPRFYTNLYRETESQDPEAADAPELQGSLAR